MSPKNHLRPHPGTVAIGAVIFALAVVGAMLLGGGRASASHVGCGDIITADTTLDSDLINCPNNGIVIGADGVTLDLNGHLIDGDRTPVGACAQDETCDVGVLSEGHDGITVRGGSVREFAFTGVGFAQARHASVLGVSSRRNGGFGILFFRCARSLVRNSSGSGSEDASGIDLTASHHVRILGNSFRDNGDQGIFISESTHNLIEGNLLFRNKFGVFLEKANRNRVRGNRSVRDREVGIYVAPGNRNLIAGNHVSHSRGMGGATGRGIEVDGGDHNVIARNSVRDPEENAILLGCPRCPVLVGNVVRGNHLRGAGEDGVHIDAKAKHTLLRRNHAFGAKDDGLDANSSTTKLTLNEASRNGDLGIEAVRGVTDGGGNRASGNGDPRQCVNVTCH
jgi:parallel beta-helix repeat protein